MPLRIELRPNEKLFIGGAVVVNGESRSTLTVLNDVPILREKDILTEAAANTHCKRIYLAIQLMYMDEANLANYHQVYWNLVRDLLAAVPTVAPKIAAISDAILAGKYYQALRQASGLVEYEKELIEHASKSA
jgi:flagellar protein FlbT